MVAWALTVYFYNQGLHLNKGYLQGKKNQLRQGKSSHNNMARKIGRTVWKSDRETVVELFYH